MSRGMILGLFGGQLDWASCGQNRDAGSRQNGQMAFLDAQQGSSEPL